MILHELGDVDRITAGAIGDPGQRTFYLQLTAGGERYSVVVEKEQVQLLSTSVLEILANVEEETGGAFDEDAMALVEPVDPLWRVGRISIRYDEERDRIALEIDEFRRERELAEMEEGDEGEEAGGSPEGFDLGALLEDDEETERIVASATREQMLALSRHGAAVVARGRPSCQFCGNPMDPEGHVCPSMNGHGKH